MKSVKVEDLPKYLLKFQFRGNPPRWRREEDSHIHTLFEDGSTNRPDWKWRSPRDPQLKLFELTDEQLDRKTETIDRIRSFYHTRQFKLMQALPEDGFMLPDGQVFVNQAGLFWELEEPISLADKIAYRSSCTQEHLHWAIVWERLQIFTRLLHAYIKLDEIQHQPWK